MFKLRTVLKALFLAAFVFPVAAEACSLKMPSDAARRAVPAGEIDVRLLDAAVRAEVNLARCRAGLRPLGDPGRRLARVAEGHSKWMAAAGRLDHRSTVSGRARLADRISAGGIRRMRTGAENIGYVSLFQIDDGPFRILDAGSCRFASYAGQPLGVHSYASIARRIVNEWMRSPGHRRNILNAQINRVGTGAAFDRSAPHCGRVWFTQIFVG